MFKNISGKIQAQKVLEDALDYVLNMGKAFHR